jgi:signal transduction histidine kinase
VLGNPSQLQYLFLDLCLNVIEAMEPGGEMTVRVADLSEGGGSTLLDPFVTTKPHGAGLGLAICRSIADARHVRNNVVEFPVPSGRPAHLTP